MHILCDISHPAHVHFFRNAIDTWRTRGHKVTIVARDKDITLTLLDEYDYEYQCLSRMRRGLIGLGLELLEHEGRLYKQSWRNPPDVFLEIGGTFIVHAAKLLRRPAIVFYDTEHAFVSNTITYPFASAVCTPTCYQGDIGPKHVRYEGYHELAYLHPNWFKPNPEVLTEIGLKPDEPLFVTRFVGWEASHDVAQKGFSLAGKINLVRALAKYGRVIITSEANLPAELQPYQMRIAASKIHHLLAFATLYIGESATMASESVVLGTPAIFVSPVGRGYTDEQENEYDMCYTISDKEEEKGIAKALELVQCQNIKMKWAEKRQQLLAKKIDVTAWMVNFVEEFVKAQ